MKYLGVVFLEFILPLFSLLESVNLHCEGVAFSYYFFKFFFLWPHAPSGAYLARGVKSLSVFLGRGDKKKVGGNGVTWTPQPIALGGAPTALPGAPGCDVFTEVRLSPAGPTTLSKRVCSL